MADENHARDRTVLLFVAPHNDLLSKGGKPWPLVEGVSRATTEKKTTNG